MKNAGVNGGRYPNENRLAESGEPVATEPVNLTAEFMASLQTQENVLPHAVMPVSEATMRGGNTGTSK